MPFNSEDFALELCRRRASGNYKQAYGEDVILVAPSLSKGYSPLLTYLAIC
jgi:hypothetical protein